MTTKTISRDCVADGQTAPVYAGRTIRFAGKKEVRKAHGWALRKFFAMFRKLAE